MMGDVGAVALLLTKLFGFAVDEDGYKQMARERKLKALMRGINDSLAAEDWTACDILMAEYRSVLHET